jgi:hypothetical protein
MVLVSVSAWAISQDDFGLFLKKTTGITTSAATTRKACVCHGGGALDQRAGFAKVVFEANQRPYIECGVPSFDPKDGHQIDEPGCADAGGTVEVLPR